MKRPTNELLKEVAEFLESFSTGDHRVDTVAAALIQDCYDTAGIPPSKRKHRKD